MMGRTKQPGGARQLQLHDWPFGAVGRRLLLDVVLRGPQPKRGWTKQALEGKTNVGTGGVDEVLAGAVQLGLLERRDERWMRPTTLPPIARPMRALLREADKLPSEAIRPLGRRAYTRRP